MSTHISNHDLNWYESLISVFCLQIILQQITLLLVLVKKKCLNSLDTCLWDVVFIFHHLKAAKKQTRSHPVLCPWNHSATSPVNHLSPGLILSERYLAKWWATPATTTTKWRTSSCVATPTELGEQNRDYHRQLPSKTMERIYRMWQWLDLNDIIEHDNSGTASLQVRKHDGTEFVD